MYRVKDYLVQSSTQSSVQTGRKQFSVCVVIGNVAYAASRRSATSDRPALPPAAGGTTNASSAAQVAAGSEAGLQSAEHGVDLANDILHGDSGGVSDAIRDGALATAYGADAADIAGSTPSTGGDSSEAAGRPPHLPRLSPADVAAGANAVAGSTGLASAIAAIGNIAGSAPRPPAPPELGSLGGLRGMGSGRDPLVRGEPPGLGRLPGGFRRLGGRDSPRRRDGEYLESEA